MSDSDVRMSRNNILYNLDATSDSDAFQCMCLLHLQLRLFENLSERNVAGDYSI